MSQFSYFALCAAQEIQGAFQKVASELNVHTQVFSNQDTLLSKLFEQECQLIVLHTDIGIEALKETLQAIKDEGMAKMAPVVIVSELKDNTQLSLVVKDLNVISIITYETWNYQFSTLVEFLSRSYVDKPEVCEINEEMIDPLTNVLNWLKAGEVFEALVSEYNDTNRPFSFIMFDVDEFKSIVKEHGEDVGDEVLVSVSSIAKQNTRKYDTVLRINNDFFAVFLSGANLQIAKTKAESFRYEIDAKGHGFDKLKATASFAVLEYAEGLSLEGLSTQAKSLMLQAKEAGKNKVAS